MTLKKCTCCGKTVTTKTAQNKGRMNLGVEMLLVNCKACGSTLALVNKKDRKLVA